MSKVKTRLTSVKVFETLYNRFKIHTIEDETNLQKVVNRSLHLYVKDADYREQIKQCTELQVSGSQF